MKWRDLRVPVTQLAPGDRVRITHSTGYTFKGTVVKPPRNLTVYHVYVQSDHVDLRGQKPIWPVFASECRAIWEA